MPRGSFPSRVSGGFTTLGHLIHDRLDDACSSTRARTHLKQIFSRCEVRSQRELLHLLATGPQDL